MYCNNLNRIPSQFQGCWFLDVWDFEKGPIKKDYTKENFELNLDEKPVFKVRGGRKEICEKWGNKPPYLPPGKVVPYKKVAGFLDDS